MEYVASGDIDPEGVHMLSTGQMLEHVEKNPDGQLHRRHRERHAPPAPEGGPAAEFVEANRMAFCKYMKMITLPKLRDSLKRDLRTR